MGSMRGGGRNRHWGNTIMRPRTHGTARRGGGGAMGMVTPARAGSAAPRPRTRCCIPRYSGFEPGGCPAWFQTQRAQAPSPLHHAPGDRGEAAHDLIAEPGALRMQDALEERLYPLRVPAPGRHRHARRAGGQPRAHRRPYPRRASPFDDPAQTRTAIKSAASRSHALRRSAFYARLRSVQTGATGEIEVPPGGAWNALLPCRAATRGTPKTCAPTRAAPAAA
jgi:hypothetical protein